MVAAEGVQGIGVVGEIGVEEAVGVAVLAELRGGEVEVAPRLSVSTRLGSSLRVIC